MKTIATVLTTTAMLALSIQGFAEIYETKDAEGNTVFTDVPTAGAKEVDVQPTNTADAPPDIPAAPRQQQAPGAVGSSDRQGAGSDEGDVVIIGDAHNERVERAVEAHRRDEVRDGEERHEVGDGEGEKAELLRRTPPAMQPHVQPHVAPHHKR